MNDQYLQASDPAMHANNDIAMLRFDASEVDWSSLETVGRIIRLPLSLLHCETLGRCNRDRVRVFVSILSMCLFDSIRCAI